MRIEIHTRFPFSWIPKIVYGYDYNRITLTVGFTWLMSAVFVSRFWDRNGCTHVGVIKRFAWYG